MNEPSLSDLRHSCAHLLAAAIMHLYPETKRAIGPAIEQGFYFDFAFTTPISEKDFPRIEQTMHELVKTWNGFTHKEVTKEEAINLFKGNIYKQELIEEFSKKGEVLTIYQSGDYNDLCKGGHCTDPSKQLRFFKLLSIAGAYWRGNEKNDMLTRIYGTCFPTKEELNIYLTLQEEAKKRDHRKIGKELELFVFSDLVGAGLPMFTPKGTMLRDTLIAFSEKLQRAHGFEKVWIPHITKVDLYKKSGHFDKFGTQLFLVQSQETDDQFVLKPMNCPHHTQIYASKTRSYKELPIRYMETTTQYRDEKAGELQGLSRVRSITVDDGHILCRMDQVEQEFSNIMSMIKEMYDALGMSFSARLSFRDESDKYLGDKKQWEEAEKIIETVAKQLNLTYIIAKGEAAFYGPKIDIMVYDALGREWQCATQQLDFVQPQRFGLTYIDDTGTPTTPVMIHKALLGSIERFLSVYIEHTMGAFPTWLAPVQMVILPIADRHAKAGEAAVSFLQQQGIRAILDDKPERLQAKIRHYTLQKVPFMGIIGDKESEDQTNLHLSIRSREGKDHGSLSLEESITLLKDSIDKKVS